MSLHDETIRALDAHPPETGVIVFHLASGRILADRDPAPGGGAVMVVLGVEPFAFPDLPPGYRREGSRAPTELPAEAASARA